MEIEIIVLVFLSVITLAFGLNIPKEGSKLSKRQKLLGCVIFSLLTWILANLFTLVFYKFDYWNLLLTRSSFAAGAIMSIAFLALVIEISNARNKIIVWGLFLVQTLWIPLSYTGLLVENIQVGENSLRSFDGSFKPLYGLTLALTFIYSFRLLFISYLQSNNANFKHQVKYILSGGIISFIITFPSSLIAPFFGVEIRSIGPLGVMVFVAFTFYAITRHRFLKLEVAFEKVLIFMLVSLIPFASFFLVYETNTRLYGSIYSLPAIISGFGETIAFVFIFQRFKWMLENLFSKKINYNYFRTKKLIDEFEDKLEFEFDQESILNKLQKLLDESLNLHRFIIIQYHVGNLIVLFSKGESSKNLYKIMPILRWAETHGLRYVDLTESKEINDKFYDILIDLQIEAIFPVDRKRYFILFSKPNDLVYTIYEIEFLLRITQILGISFQRADLYQKQKEFNEILKEQVEKATKKISKQKAIIQKKYEEERDIIGILGHELRTPLTVAKMTSDVLRSRVEEMKNSRKVDYDYVLSKINKIIESLSQEANIVETALSTSRIDNNKIEITESKINVIEMINYAIDSHKQLAEQKGLSLEFENPSFNVPLLISDSAKVQEIITNLVSNAVKYTNKGYVKVRLEIDEKYLHIVVEDSGIGIPKELLGNLGQKFYRINQHLGKDNKVVRPGGTGLGLYVVKNYVRILGGKLDIQSEVGKGSVFTVYLPLKNSDKVKNNETMNIEGENIPTLDMFERLGLRAKK